jgi:hypothetical protein
MVALMDDWDTSAAAGDDYMAVVYHGADRADLYDLLRARRGYDPSPAAS